MTIRKNDIVTVITGEEKGKKGKVLSVDAASGRVLVEGVNFIWKHLRRSQQHPHGARIQKEASIHASNVKIECQSCNKLTRVISKKLAEGGRARICKKCGQSVAPEV
jgi:large subunit ribosomal protein L24